MSLADWIAYADRLVWGPWMLALLTGTGVFLLFRTRFLPWRNLGWALRSVLSREARQGGHCPADAGQADDRVRHGAVHPAHPGRCGGEDRQDHQIAAGAGPGSKEEEGQADEEGRRRQIPVVALGGDQGGAGHRQVEEIPQLPPPVLLHGEEPRRHRQGHAQEGGEGVDVSEGGGEDVRRLQGNPHLVAHDVHAEVVRDAEQPRQGGRRQKGIQIPLLKMEEAAHQEVHDCVQGQQEEAGVAPLISPE